MRRGFAEKGGICDPKEVLSNRPTAVGFNNGVYLSHEADGFGQGHYDLLVVVKFFKGESAAFAVLEPLMAHLIAPDGESPHLRRDTFNVLL